MPSNADRAEQLLNVDGVARRLNVTVRYVRRLVAERRIAYIKVGHLVRFDPSDVEAWIARSRVDDAEAPAKQHRRRVS